MEPMDTKPCAICQAPIEPSRTYCGTPCRIEGLRRRNQATKQESIGDAIESGTLKHEPTRNGDMYSGTTNIGGEECFVIVCHRDKPNNPDWRRPAGPREAMESWHRKPMNHGR